MTQHSALVELIGREPDPPKMGFEYNPISNLAVSAATVAGTVLHNPRLAKCTRIIGSYNSLSWW